MSFICTPEVEKFRKTLSPEESELFNECLSRICRNPRVDKIHKFHLFTRLPLIDIMYRDDNFVLIYYPTETSSPSVVRRIHILKATRTSDFGQTQKKS